MTNAMWVFLVMGIGIALVVGLPLYIDHRQRAK